MTTPATATKTPRVAKPPHIAEVTSNVKSPDGQAWTVTLEPGGNYIVGTNGAGKTMLEDAIRLGMTGSARIRGRVVRAAQLLAELGPPGDGEVFAQVKLSNGLTFRWSLRKKETRDADGFIVTIKTSNLKHSTPDGFNPAMLTWADEIAGALVTDSSAARATLAEKLANSLLTDADLQAAIEPHADLRAALVARADALRDKVGIVRVTALGKMAAAVIGTSTKINEGLQAQVEEAPLPSELEEARTRHEAALAQERTWSAQAEAWIAQVAAGSEIPKWGLPALVAFAQQHNVTWDADALGRALEGLRTVTQSTPAVPDMTQPRAIRDLLGRNLAAYDGYCQLCGEARPQLAMAHRLSTLDTWIANVTASTAEARDGRHAALHMVAGLIGAWVRDNLGPLRATVHAADTHLRDLQNRQQRARGAAQAVAGGAPPSGALEVINWTAVQEQAGKVINRLLKAAIDKATDRASSYLPDGVALVSRLNPADGAVQWGIKAPDGFVYSWLSGWEESLVLAAYCMAAVPDGYPALYCMPDVSVHEDVLKASLQALAKSPVQWIWTGTLRPKGRGVKGVNILEVAPRVKRATGGTGDQGAGDVEQQGEGAEETESPPPPSEAAPPPPGAEVLPFTAAAPPPPPE